MLDLFKLGAETLPRLQSGKPKKAIRFAGEQLVKGGYVQPEYVQAMLDFVKTDPDLFGQSIAVPHGTVEAKDRVLKTGVVLSSANTRKACRFGEEERTLPVW